MANLMIDNRIMIKSKLIDLILFIFVLVNYVHSYALPGKIDVYLNDRDNSYPVITRGLYNNTEIQIKITCEEDTVVKIGWLLRESPCIDEFYVNSDKIPGDIYSGIYYDPRIYYNANTDVVEYVHADLKEYKCSHSIIDLYTGLDQVVEKIKLEKSTTQAPKRADESSKQKSDAINKPANRRKRGADSPATSANLTNAPVPTKPAHKHIDFDTIAKTWRDGAYLFILYTESVSNNQSYSLNATISFKYKDGYITGTDWPFLPFYGVMCGIYIIYALVWFTCSCFYWRDILRIQFWIGAVILLGMIEKTAYLAEYESLNRTGYVVKFGVICAEFISCLKRSLARMLVIIVSLGFGIVKPRLGPILGKVVGVGVLYFILALLDGLFRILDRKEDTDSKGILAGIPLVVLDVSICYWILTGLQTTMRTLKVRRNIPKLTLYRHFTNTLVFCVIASVIFMIWSLKRHRFVNCLQDWKELWLDDAFWHILFSFILLVIIILWRPSNNSQRFLFTPLLDNEEDADELDESQENEVFDSIKMRTKANDGTTVKNTKNQNKDKTIEDELKWVEEHVPTSVTETALPGIIDSDEEVMTTRFEISKMD